MKYINLFILFILFSCSSKRDAKDTYQMYPPYKLINLFSEKIKPETGLVLNGYGINIGLPKGYEVKNGIGNFRASYSLSKDKNDEISLDYARNLIVFLAENLLLDINSDLGIRANLDVYPCSSDGVNIAVHFKDKNKIDLGQGVAIIYFSKGKIKYKGYKIFEYSDKYPADGKHYTIHEESYAEALDIVKKQGNLKYLQ